MVVGSLREMLTNCAMSISVIFSVETAGSIEIITALMQIVQSVQCNTSTTLALLYENSSGKSVCR